MVFTYSRGKSVLNQKSELQRAYDKQKERHAAAEQHSPDADIVGGIPGLKGECVLFVARQTQANVPNTNK